MIMNDELMMKKFQQLMGKNTHKISQIQICLSQMPQIILVPGANFLLLYW